MAKKPAPPLSQAGGGWRGKAPQPPPRSGLNPSGPPPHHHHRKPHHHGGGAPPAPPLSQAGGGWRGKAPAHKKAKKHPKRKLAGAPLAGGWILGGNDTADNCAAVAVANALLLSSGLRTSDAELARLHDRAGPLSIAEALAALGAAFTELQTQPGDRSPWSVVAGLATPHGSHAGLLLGGDLVTWGGLMALPGDWDVEECWAVTW